MRKVILNFQDVIAQEGATRRKIHEYIAEKMNFPQYYGHNLDALYDCLTDICEPTAVGIAVPEGMEDALEENDSDKDVLLRYLDRILRTFQDAEAGNPNLAVLGPEYPAGKEAVKANP